MSRLTGADAYGLMEAYNNVYAPQELTEEQVWEEVETWVNSLLEEGYDLSDYTWEEMFEAYIEEQGRGTRTGSNPNISQNPIAQAIRGDGPARTLSAADRSRRNARPGSSSPIPRMANLGAGYKSAELQQSAKARASQLGTGRTGAGGVSMGGGNAGASVQPPPKPTPNPVTPVITKQKPVITKQKPVTPTATATAAAPKPAADPAAKPAGSAMDQWAKANPRLAQAQQIRKQGGSRAEVNKVLYNKGTAAASTPAASTPAAFSPKPQSDVGRMITRSQARQAAQTPKPATPAPAARPMGNARERMLQRQSFDVFDAIKGHLIDEGYADTEESALAIMINMSEDWILSIIQ
jgi:hypothetical protein